MTPQLIVILFFIAISLVLIALYSAYATVKASPHQELRKRLKNLVLRPEVIAPSDLTTEIMRETSPLDKFIYKLKFMKRLDMLIDNAGIGVDVKIFMLIIILFSLAGLVIGILLGRGIIFPIILLFAGAIAPLIFLKIKKNKRIWKFTEQFPNALDMIARSLRAGHALSTAIQMVGSEMPEPLAGLFKTVYEEQTLGLPLKDSLSQLLERMQSMDLRLFVTAVNIHREVGGNLAETLERLAQTIRERIRIRRQVRVYTAQGRLTGYILAALPIFMAFLLYFLMPDYIAELNPFKVKLGRYIVIAAVTAQIIGFIIIKKLINIKI